MTPQELLLSGRGTPRERFDALASVFQPKHAAMLRSLDYHAFLQTPYWRIVSRHVRIQRGACNRCGARSGLQAHHRTYKHHGMEHEHLADLEVLCRDCHRVEHRQVHTAAGEWRSVGQLLPEAFARMVKEAA